MLELRLSRLVEDNVARGLVLKLTPERDTIGTFFVLKNPRWIACRQTHAKHIVQMGVLKSRVAPYRVCDTSIIIDLRFRSPLTRVAISD